eukprot:sb/3463132/
MMRRPEPKQQQQRHQQQNEPLQKLCIVLDLAQLEKYDERFMARECFLYRPNTLPLETCQEIVGVAYTLHEHFSVLKPGQTFVQVMKAHEYRLAVQKIPGAGGEGGYFFILSGPPDMTEPGLVGQMKLLVESVLFFTGPFSQLNTRLPSSEERELSLRRIVKFAIDHVIPDRDVTFRNNLGYLPIKSCVTPECTLKCQTTFSELGVMGGAVLYEGKIVCTDLPNSLLAVVRELTEKNVPVERLRGVHEAVVVEVHLSPGMCPEQPSSDCHITRDETRLDAVLEGMEEEISGGEGGEVGGSLATPEPLITNDYEVLKSEVGSVPEDGLAMNLSRKLLTSLSQEQSRYSVTSELFDCRAQQQKKNDHLRRSQSAVGPESMYTAYTAVTAATRNNSPGSLETSLNSVLSGSELPGNSLNFLLKSIDLSEDAGAGSKPSDASSEDQYHESHEYLPSETVDLVTCEMMLLTRVNTTVVLFGENLAGRINDLWKTCLILLGDVNGYFNLDSGATRVTNTTENVNSYAFNKVTRSLQTSSAGRTSHSSHEQIKFCKWLADSEEGLEMVVVQGVRGNTVMRETPGASVFLTSHAMRGTKLADNLTNVTFRNFDSIFL